MDARTERTLLRLLSLFLAAGAADAIVQFVSDGRYDWRHLLGALAVAGVMAVEQYLKNTGGNAAPTVAGVSAAIQANVSTVPPPSVAVPEAHVLTTPPAPVEPPHG